MLIPATPRGIVRNQPPVDVDETATGAMRVIAALLAQRTGQKLSAGRAWRIDSVLQPLMRSQNIANLEVLVGAMACDASGGLANQVVEALLNQETSFFRDAGVIELAAEVLTARRAAEPNRRPRIWSAGCSNGQEPYSLAMVLAEAHHDQPRAMPDIVATDVSPSALTRARLGRFTQFEIQRGLPIRRLLQWFDQDGEEFVARQDLVRLVSFRQNNLAADPPPYGQFDLILCRNVLLYFPPSVRRYVFDQLASALRPGGALILGAGETTIGQTDRFVPSPRFRGCYDRADAVTR